MRYEVQMKRISLSEVQTVDLLTFVCRGCEQLDRPQVKEMVATVRRQSIENQKTVSCSQDCYLVDSASAVLDSSTADRFVSFSHLHKFSLLRILLKTLRWRNCGRS